MIKVALMVSLVKVALTANLLRGESQIKEIQCDSVDAQCIVKSKMTNYVIGIMWRIECFFKKYLQKFIMCPE